MGEKRETAGADMRYTILCSMEHVASSQAEETRFFHKHVAQNATCL